MSKFKAIFFSSSDRSNPYVIGTYNTKESAAQHACEYAYAKSYMASCETKTELINSLMERDYYMLAYGPRELEIEEVMA